MLNMIPKFLVIFLIAFVFLIEATPKATPSQSYSNNTSTALKSATTPVCCFVVQDTVTEEWFQETSFSTTHSVVNLTSITTFLTVYPNTTKTALETNVYTTNHTYNYTIDIGINPITIMTNDAPGPAETTVMNVNGTAVITGGMTLPSPGAFYVYNTVKIITATAITDKNGNLACGTTSSFPRSVGFDDGEKGKGPIPTFSNINKYAQAYFGGLDIDGQMSKPTTTLTDTVTNTFTYSESKPIHTTTKTNTLTITNKGAFFTNSKGEIVTQKERPSGIVISLTTPFVYAPSRGAKGETGEGRQCLQSGESVNYGWIPQTLINFLASNEAYKSQYPGIESCLPAGPSILQIKDCMSVLPTFEAAGGDLTSGTTIFITPEPAKLPPTTSWSSTDTYPTTQSPATKLIPTSESTDTYPTTQQPATQLVPTFPANPPPISTPPANNPPADNLPADNNQPANTPPPNNPPSDNTQPPNNLPADNQANQPSAPVGSIINSIINPSNPTEAPSPLIIPAATTIPLSLLPSSPSLFSFSTTFISNTPFIIIPSPTTIFPAFPTPPPPKNFNIGSTTTINNMPFIVIASTTTIPLAEATELGLVGNTTVVSGTTEVVVGPTTVAVPTGAGSGDGNVNGTTDGFVQASTASGDVVWKGGWGVGLLVMGIWSLAS